MARIQRTLAELQDHLKDQLYFLETSALAYNQGHDREAKRLATALRILVHDMSGGKRRGSRSILAQLNMKSQPYYDSALDYNPGNWVAHAGLTCVALDPHDRCLKSCGSPGIAVMAHQYDRVMEQTWPRPTLLVKSQTHGTVVLYTTFEGPRDRIHSSGDTPPYGVGD